MEECNMKKIIALLLDVYKRQVLTHLGDKVLGSRLVRSLAAFLKP